MNQFEGIQIYAMYHGRDCKARVSVLDTCVSVLYLCQMRTRNGYTFIMLPIKRYTYFLILLFFISI